MKGRYSPPREADLSKLEHSFSPRLRHGVGFSADLCEEAWFSNSPPQLRRGGCATNKMSPFLSGADGVVLVNKFGCAARVFDQHHPGGAEYLR